MADETIRKQYGIDEILRRIPKDQGEFFAGFVPWPEDVAGWGRSAREALAEAGERSLMRTIWDQPEDRESRVLIDVVECGSEEDAVEALADRLEANQLARVPEGPGNLGLVSFQHPTFAPPAVFFVRGNLAIVVISFGRKSIDVAQIASRVNARLDERPAGELRPLTLEAEPTRGKVGQEILLRYAIPVWKVEDGYVKLYISGGTIARREGRLVMRARAEGRLDVKAYLVEPGREPYRGELAITIE